MVRITSAALLSTLLSLAHAGWVNFPATFQVGKLVKLQWELKAGDAPDRLVLQHEDRSGEVLQYETLVQWSDASGENNVGAGVTFVNWIPNVPGPAFHLELWPLDGGRIVGSDAFEILAADGSAVGDVGPMDRFSNIMPQTATPVWYPNNPDATAAASTSAAPSSSATTTTVASTSTSATVTSLLTTIPVIPVLTSSASAAPYPTFTTVVGHGITGSNCTNTTVVGPTGTLLPSSGGSKNSTATAMPSIPAQVSANAASAVKAGAFSAVLLGAFAACVL
ncbi:MAG: hypothetical protein M1818_000025 [Claussenomyces sp. TS43310]|nr:MAG: hypothetical protein M1818_000025 [Claussenomyces sp. TS43310]